MTTDFLFADNKKEIRLLHPVIQHRVTDGSEKIVLIKTLAKQKYLQAFVLAGMAYLFVFSYLPLIGITMAFKDYKISMGIQGIFSSDWVGFKYFLEFFNEYGFWKLVRNTVAISLLKLIFSFPIPILFAIMLNEISFMPVKKLVQTCSYLPHFISWVIISGMAFAFFSSSGVINSIALKFHFINEAIPFLTDANRFWSLAVVSDIWKDMGWWAIIFLAAIAGISQEMYEAAEIDGISRLKKIWYITLPSIKGTIIVILILALGKLFGGGLSGSNFEQSYLLGNSMTSEKSDIIQTYVFNVGLAQGRYAYATAVGLIQSVISLILTFGSNFFAKKISGEGLF
jgi:putative aldouronate transport system permease protein